ncbi:uncharacterized protein BO96DRAFT_433533 [Aspergillus niger CBS 101883]|uniref:Uncharacterized protein n=2 Tax=Aspergillus niger TaxID=5061 RepID=A2QAT2_ASPNC|nr:uncharacterized protein BO96DRAFT_433533 [Aspergillus niger CBS 101883]XP_059599799.1 hypothetical protein An01g12660 [Aspergillus niger]PYH57369.1 hypothetical protein BO96DRAFT_433533 [Aspergillus niger CBS 101883]CAK37316.1 hypothetical protein An01g12660 [Aspergillus niger]
MPSWTDTFRKANTDAGNRTGAALVKSPYIIVDRNWSQHHPRKEGRLLTTNGRLRRPNGWANHGPAVVWVDISDGEHWKPGRASKVDDATTTLHSEPGASRRTLLRNQLRRSVEMKGRYSSAVSVYLDIGAINLLEIAGKPQLSLFPPPSLKSILGSKVVSFKENKCEACSNAALQRFVDLKLGGREIPKTSVYAGRAGENSRFDQAPSTTHRRMMHASPPSTRESGKR